MPIFELIVRLAIAFLTLLLLTRLMGRKELAQMTFFNFISGIAIGSIGASLALNSTVSIRNGIIALILWSFFTIAMGFIDINSKSARKAIEGQPRILIKNGEIMESELREVRLDLDALTALLREKNAFSISEVDYAIFETSGKLSVLKKELNQPVTKSDMNIQPSVTNFSPVSTGVIFDGIINTANLKKLHLDKQWLQQQLEVSGFESVSNVFYAEVQKNGTLYIDPKKAKQ
ncbi:YetF domain-containing protein [Halobacillus seohaensis]|uniref:YetF domain-containing protein n=1 Tax=Halobacillus seohaensis TaxID=447421 RepID=A0ABW2ELT9_9BACI